LKFKNATFLHITFITSLQLVFHSKKSCTHQFIRTFDCGLLTFRRHYSK